MISAMSDRSIALIVGILAAAPLGVPTDALPPAARAAPPASLQAAAPDEKSPAVADTAAPDLRLEGSGVSEEGIARLAHRHWGTVTLADCRLNGGILERLRHAASIRVLRLSGNGVSGQISRLEQVNGLVGLEISQQHLNVRDLEAIGRLTGLEMLSLPTELAINVLGAREIARLVKLKSLQLYGVDIDDSAFAELAPLIRLEELDLTHTRITDAGLSTIVKMPRLRKLKLDRHAQWFIHQQLTDECLASITRLTDLELLSLSGAITNEGLRQVARLPKLTSLSILNTQITADGLGTLEESKVENLTLGTSQAGIYDNWDLPDHRGLVALRRCRSLKHLCIIGGGQVFDPHLFKRVAEFLPKIGIEVITN
jgi:hypothetical protein